MLKSIWILRVSLWGLLALLTLEVAARVDDWVSYDAPPLGRYHIEGIFEYDELGKKGAPNARYLKWKLNRLGFRGPDPQPGRPTVFTMGASETFGLYESPGQEYPRQLERELQARLGADRVQVVNVAYAGLSVGSDMIRLHDHLAALQPQVAVLYPSLAAYIQPPEGEWRLSQKPPATGLLDSVRVWPRTKDLIKEILPLFIQDRIRKQETSAFLAGDEVWERLPESHVERFRSDLRRIVRTLQAAGVQPLLATHATRFGAELRPEDKTYILMWRKFYPQLAEEGFLDMERRLNQALREVAQEESTALADPAAKIAGVPEYFAEFVHFTDAGAHAMAVLLADALEPMLREPAETSSTPGS